MSDSIRYASSIKPVDKINPKEEKESGSAVIEAHPEAVSLDSSVRQVFKEKGKEEPEEEEEMLAGVYSDWVSVPPAERTCRSQSPLTFLRTRKSSRRQ